MLLNLTFALFRSVRARQTSLACVRGGFFADTCKVIGSQEKSPLRLDDVLEIYLHKYLHCKKSGEEY